MNIVCSGVWDLARSHAVIAPAGERELLAGAVEPCIACALSRGGRACLGTARRSAAGWTAVAETGLAHLRMCALDALGLLGISALALLDLLPCVLFFLDFLLFFELAACLAYLLLPSGGVNVTPGPKAEAVHVE